MRSLLTGLIPNPTTVTVDGDPGILEWIGHHDEPLWIVAGAVALKVEWDKIAGEEERIRVSAWPNGNECPEFELASMEVTQSDARAYGGLTNVELDDEENDDEGS